MGISFYDRVAAYSASVGTGPIAPGAAVTGYQSFSAVAAGSTVSYTITDGAAWEVGRGTWNGGTLVRSPLFSSNNGSAIACSGINTTVFVTVLAADILSLFSSTLGQPKSVLSAGCKCDGQTDDTNALNAALASGGWWTLPPNSTTVISSTITIPSNAALSGSGYSSVVNMISGTTSAIVLGTTSENTYMWVSDFILKCTASGGGSSGGGIVAVGDSGISVLKSLIVQGFNYGLYLLSTSQGFIEDVTTQQNNSDGIVMLPSSISTSCQWSLNNVLSQKNGGWGARVASTGSTPLTLSTWNNVNTFANTSGGAAGLGTSTAPVSGFRINNSFFGQDNGHELYFDYCNQVNVTDTFAELAGTAHTGPSLGTAPTNTGDGVHATTNTTDISVSGCRITQCSGNGINTAASIFSKLTGNALIANDGYGVLAADGSKLLVASNAIPTTSGYANTAGQISITANASQAYRIGNFNDTTHVLPGTLSATQYNVGGSQIATTNLGDVSSGSWTPTDASGASLSLSVVDAHYVKIGNMVFANANLSYPSTANGSNVAIAGLPFTAAGGGPYSGAIGFISTAANWGLALGGGTETLSLYKNGAVATNANMSGLGIIFSVAYPLV